jgi:serine/threonine protein kinase
MYTTTGEDLNSLKNSLSSISSQMTMNFAIKMINILEKLHSRGIIHCAVNLQNIEYRRNENESNDSMQGTFVLNGFYDSEFYKVNGKHIRYHDDVMNKTLTYKFSSLNALSGIGRLIISSHGMIWSDQ